MLRTSLFIKLLLHLLRVLMMLPRSLSNYWKMEAKEPHNLEEKEQLLRRCSIVSSCTSQRWHLEGPRTPCFLILSQVKIFLCCTNHVKSLIFIQPCCLQSLCQDLSWACEAKPRRIFLASLILKVPLLLLPHLSWSFPSQTRIFLQSNSCISILSLSFKELSSIISSFLHFLHFLASLVQSHKSLTLINLLAYVFALSSFNYSFKRMGSCCHFSSQNRAKFSYLISQKPFSCTRPLLSQALFHMRDPLILPSILIWSSLGHELAYFSFQIVAHWAFCSFSQLHHNLAPRAFLKFSGSSNPRPPWFLGLQIFSQATKVHFLFVSPFPKEIFFVCF